MGLAVARRVGARSIVVTMVGNGAGSALRTGDWAWALAEIEATHTDEAEMIDRLTMLEPMVGLRAMRGDPVDDLMSSMMSIGGTSTEPVALASILHARASVAFAEGRLGDARVAWQRGAGLIAEYLPTSLAGAARAALWSEDAAGAADNLAALDGSGFHGPAVEADRKTIRAGIAALDGRPGDAMALYREALRAWRDLGVPWDEALCAIDMATLLDPSEPEVRAAAEAAREILVRLEARPFIARLDAATSRATDPSAAAPLAIGTTAATPASPKS
jgi:tetratricopeptide (TPR) repeat protein